MPIVLPRVMTAVVLVLGMSVAAQAGPDVPSLDLPPPPKKKPEPPAPPPPFPLQNISKPAVLKSGSITIDDYPILSVRNEEEGKVLAVFTIGKNGRVSACSATGASERLSAHTCMLIQQRFVFQPARDLKGKVTTDQRVQRINWMLEDSAPIDDPIDDITTPLPPPRKF